MGREGSSEAVMSLRTSVAGISTVLRDIFAYLLHRKCNLEIPAPFLPHLFLLCSVLMRSILASLLNYLR